MFEDAIRYPWTGEDRFETLLIGGLLGILSVFVLPAFVVAGYLVRVVRRVAAGDDEVPPGFEDWEELLVDGVKAAVIVVVYGLVPGLAFLVVTASFVVQTAAVSDGVTTGVAIGAVGVLVGLLVLLLTVLSAVGFLYLVPAGVAALARTGRLTAAFSPSHLGELALDGRYLTGWLVALGIAILANVAAGALAATVVGGVLVPFVTFYGNVAGAYAIGTAVREIPAGEHEAGAIPSGGRTA